MLFSLNFMMCLRFKIVVDIESLSFSSFDKMNLLVSGLLTFSLQRGNFFLEIAANRFLIYTIVTWNLNLKFFI